jgi:cytoskeletal protein CcmA (bactofilin family)
VAKAERHLNKAAKTPRFAAPKSRKAGTLMLHSSDSQKSPSSPTSTGFAPISAAGNSTEQATIGRSLVIKGEVSGGESLYIDGCIEGSITVAEHRVTIGRNGKVTANVTAREVVIMGKVKGNIQCTDRLDIRGEGSLTGDVVTQRISVEDGAILKGSVQVRAAESGKPNGHAPAKSQESSNSGSEQQKAATVGA